jgi:ketosteroid isomerase-like protein
VVTDEEMKTVRAGYELWNQGDIAGLAAMCFADDIEYRVAPDWPGQQVYRGTEDVARFLKEEVAEVIELSDVEIDRMEVFGDEILIALRARTRGVQSGLDIGMVSIYHVALMRDGKVARVRVYMDETEAITAAKTEND